MTSIYLVSQDGAQIIDEFNNYVGASISINEDGTNELSFEIVADEKSMQLESQARLLVQFMGEWYEFIVQEVDVFYGSYQYRSIKAYPAHDDLKVIHFLAPFSRSRATVISHLDFILYGSGWEIGEVDYTANERAFSSESIKSAFDLIKELSNVIGHEVRYRIDVDEERNAIKRYVDLIIDSKELSGKEIKFGRDLERLRKSIKYSQVYTQLYVIGPETEGVEFRPYVTVTDASAFELFNRNGKHVQDVYTPNITADLSGYALTERLRQLGLLELSKRNKAALEWEVDVSRLDNQEGMEHERYRMNQWVLVRNSIEGALYKAKVSGIQGMLKNPSSLKVKISIYEKVGDI